MIDCVIRLVAGVTLVCTTGCGAFSPPLFAINDNKTTDQVCLDLWSLVHFGSGYYLGDELGDDSLVPTVGLLTAYELAEPHFWPGFNESELNQRCDVLVGTLGWLAETRADE
ncbi:MAG: hypothetical protein ACYTFA_16660 [Planctomycetota bacterium]